MTPRVLPSRLLAFLTSFILILAFSPAGHAGVDPEGSSDEHRRSPAVFGFWGEVLGASPVAEALGLSPAPEEGIDPDAANDQAGDDLGAADAVTSAETASLEGALDEATADSAALVGVHPDVHAALASAEGGVVDVIIEVHGGVDAEQLRWDADLAAWDAVDAAREQGETLASASTQQAADEARAAWVVQTLQDTGAVERAVVLDVLTAGAAAQSLTNDPDTAAATRISQVRDLWIVNSVAGPVDTETLAELSGLPEVRSIALDREIVLPEIQDGPLLPEWSLEKVAAPQTWGEYGYRGDGITVAVLDTGVDVSHPALAQSYRGSDGDHSASWYVTTGENYPTPGDGHGHGTHVAGSITGGAPGEVIGVAPEAEYIGVKILNDGGRGGTAGILDGMQWLLAPGGDPTLAPDIANNSWGISSGGDAVYWSAVEAWRAAGIVPVFAAGNAGPFPGTLGSPGDYPHSFTVGATDRNDAIAEFSSRGPVFWDGEQYTKPDVSAPGHEIRSAWPTALGMEYRTISGTSMATPHVSGVLALTLQANPGLSVADLEQVLEQTTRVEPRMGEVPNDVFGHGIVDAHAAATRAAHSGVVTGTITGPGGEPITTTVQVIAPELGIGTTAHPSTGAYELWLPAGQHTIEVEAYGYATASVEVEVAEGDETLLDVELALADLATVNGTVTDGDTPVPGAVVSIVGESAVADYTDADGGYELSVAHGRHQLRVSANGYQPWVGTIDVDGDLSQDIALSALPDQSAQEWPELKGNAAATGLADSALYGPSLDEQWRIRVPAVSFASPVIAGGSVYVLSLNGTLNAIDAESGQLRWTAATGGTQRGTPAVHGDQILVTTGANATLRSLSTADGAMGWEYDLGADLPTFGAPTVQDGVVYVAVGNADTGAIHAVDLATGQGLWRTDIGSGVFFGPSVGGGYVVAASIHDPRIVAVHQESGEIAWTHTDGDQSLSLAAIADGRVYIGTSTMGYDDGAVLALDLETGEQLWRAANHGDTQGSGPSLYGDLAIIGSHGNGSVAAYDRQTGELAWHHLVGTAVTSSVTVTTSGVVLGGSQDRSIFALDAATGQRLWSDTLPASILSTPAVSGGQAVFVSSDGTVAAYTTRGTITGTVTGPDGPIEADIEILGTEIATTSDPDTGEYLLQPPVGEHTIRISAYGFTDHTETVQVGPVVPVEVDANLTAVGSGSLQGHVVDEDGEPLPGASLTLLGTPLASEVTDGEGFYTFPSVAEGSHLLEVSLPGYVSVTEPVIVAADEVTTQDVVLELYDIAVVADYDGAISEVLVQAGWRVDQVSFAEIEGAVDRYRAVVLNGNGTDRADADLDRLAAIVDQADASGVSLVLLDQWAPSYGSIVPYLAATDRDGSLVTHYGNRGQVWLTDPVEHDLTDSIGPGRHVILNASHHGWLEGYEGYHLAQLGSDGDGRRGTGLGYERVGYDSAHILLTSLASTPWAGPNRTWHPQAGEVLIDAVDHALAAEFGAVTATVTADGAPVDAVISVVGSFERATVDGGTAELLLDPGSHTVRIQSLGYTTVEVEVEVTAGQSTPIEVALEPGDSGAIAGVVRDASGGAPVPGAAVTVTELDLDPVSTGTTGTFTLPDLPVGTYSLAVEAEGFSPVLLEDVEVELGQTTQVEIDLPRAPRVAVVGDRLNRLTDLLAEHGIPAIGTGWEVADDLSEVDLVLVNNPGTVTGPVFLNHLQAFDEAGVSVIWTAGNTATSTRGIHLLSQHTGNPEAVVSQGGINQPVTELTSVVDHPILQGIGEEPVAILNAGAEAPWFDNPSGYVLADIGLDGVDGGGPGIAYDVRTPDSVHVLLSGLGATSRNNPATFFTPEGTQIFLNAVRWSASPQLAQLTGEVADPDGTPIPFAEVVVEGHDWSSVGDENGQWRLGLPDGEFTLTFSAFGYVDEQVEVTVTGGAAQAIDVVLQPSPTAALSGVVTSVSEAGTGEPGDGGPLEGVEVRLSGTALVEITDDQGRYTFDRVVPGDQELELEADGHARTIHPFVMPEADHTEDVGLRVSPRVGVVGDSTTGVTAGRTAAFLEDWGYEPVTLGWQDTTLIADLDLIVVNIATTGWNPGEEGLVLFQDAANRNGVPIIWTGNHSRGGIQFLTQHQEDPESWASGTLSGVVTTTVTAEHPLTAGLPEAFEGTEPGRFFGYFDGFSGTTVATISSELNEHSGDAVAFRARTVDTVDVLLSAVNNSSYGALGTRTEAPLYLTEHSSRLFVNALQWGLAAEGLGADARGTVVTSDGQPVEAVVHVEETGNWYPARSGDGAFIVPVEPGTWTLTASAFGFSDASIEVTVEAGQTVRPQIVLPTSAGAAVTGTVTDASGAPLADAQIVVHGTEITATTNGAGQYTIAHLPEGEWLFSAAHDDGRTRFTDVTVADGVPTTQNFTLGAPAHAIILGDQASGALATFLEGHGFTAEPHPYAGLADLDLSASDAEIVVVNGAGAVPSQENFLAFVDHAADHDVPLVFTSQWNSGSIRHLSSFTGNPESTANAFRPGQIGYEVVADHPILDGYGVGDIVPLLDNGTLNQQFGSFAGWDGVLLADTVHPPTEENLGGGLGYRFATPGSVHLLLGSLNVGSYGAPATRWQVEASRVYLNALDWAMQATQSQVYGSVTGAGEPIEGAQVRVQGTATSTLTGADGQYALGVVPGELTIEVSAAGYQTSTHPVTVEEEQELHLDVELIPLPTSSLTVEVVDAVTDDAVPGAEATVTGPTELSAVTGPDGLALLEPLPAGDYQVTVEADGYLAGAAQITVGAEPASVRVELQPISVAILGDLNGELTDWLVDNDIAAESVNWAEATEVIDDYQVAVVNGGQPGAEQFADVVEAADEASVALLFTGSYGVDRGGIRLLEQYSDQVVVGGQGYGDGTLGLAAFDEDHPIFAGIEDPTRILEPDGYYSWIAEYPGHLLADLTVAGSPVGAAVTYEVREAGGAHLLVSFGALTEHQGPGRGWNEDTARVLLNSIDWLHEERLAVPTLTGPELVGENPVTVEGTALGADRVLILRDEEVLADVEVDGAGAYTATVDLVEGSNVLIARAGGLGDIQDSAPHEIVVDLTPPELQVDAPLDGTLVLSPDPAIEVRGTVSDELAGVESLTVQGIEVDVDADGGFETELILEPGVTQIEVIAVDAVGHQSLAQVEVRYEPVSARWAFPSGPDGAGVALALVDRYSTPLLADTVVFEVLSGEDVVASLDGELIGTVYRAELDGVPPGEYQVRAVVTIDGFTATVPGRDLSVTQESLGAD